MNAVTSRRRRLLAAGTALCCAPLLAMPAAHAATSPFDPISTLTDTLPFSVNPGVSPSGTCTDTSPGTTTTPPVPLVTNKPAVSAGSTNAVTGASSSDGTDTVSANATQSAKAWLRSSGSNPTSVDFTVTGSAGVTTSKPVSACTATASTALGAAALVTLDRPTVITADASGRGTGGYIWGVLPGSNFSGVSGALGFGTLQSTVTHTTMYLPAGKYTVIAGGIVGASSDRTQATRAGSARVHLAFAVAGSRKAIANSGYVTMPASRNCTTHQVSPRITTHKKKAKKIKSVAFFVNGRKAKSLKHPHKGRTVALSTVNDTPITVTARAKVRVKVGKHKFRTRTITSTASYLQCS